MMAGGAVSARTTAAVATVTLPPSSAVAYSMNDTMPGRGQRVRGRVADQLADGENPGSTRAATASTRIAETGHRAEHRGAGRAGQPGGGHPGHRDAGHGHDQRRA